MKKYLKVLLISTILIMICFYHVQSNEFNFKTKNIVFLSPHPDDVPLTFGGLLLVSEGFKDKNVTVSTFFNRSQYTDNCELWNLSLKRINTVTETRFKEDLESLSNIFNDGTNARFEYYGFNDSIIRHYQGKKTAGGGPWGDFSTFKEPERQAFDQIKGIIKSKLIIPDITIFLLMANGQHIDHFIVREALIAAVKELGPEKLKATIYFGEDQQYTGANPNESKSDIEYLTNRLHLEPIAYPINIDEKLKLFTDYYYSQYCDSYIKDTTARYDLLGGKEQIYLWPSKYYNNISKDRSEK